MLICIDVLSCPSPCLSGCFVLHVHLNLSRYRTRTSLVLVQTSTIYKAHERAINEECRIGSSFLREDTTKKDTMSVEVLVAGVGAAFLLVLLLMVLKDTCVHSESEC